MSSSFFQVYFCVFQKHFQVFISKSFTSLNRFILGILFLLVLWIVFSSIPSPNWRLFAHTKKHWLLYIACVHAKLFQSDATLWDPMDHRPPLFMGFCRQEYWSGLPFPPPGYLPYTGIKFVSLTSPVLAGGFFTTSTTWEALCILFTLLNFPVVYTKFFRQLLSFLSAYYLQIEMILLPTFYLPSIFSFV